MIKNVAIYCRVSTDEQKKFGISVSDQKHSLTKYCKNNNYKIYDYYIDEGVSAGSIKKRKELLRLLNDLEHIDLIVFTKLDRFSRNVRDANNLLVILDEHSTSFRAIDEDDIDTSTADGRFIFNLKVNLAEHERNKDSERIRRTNKYKYEVTKTVCTGKMPYGYKISNEKKMIIDEDKAPHIKELFDYYLKTNNLNKTTKWFSDNYETRSSKMIRTYLSNSCYIGLYKTSSGLLLENFCEPILEKELFDNVQRLLEKNVKNYLPDPTRKRHNPSPYIFSGLLKCPKCGCNLSGKVNTGGSHYYNCKKRERGNCSNRKCISEFDIEKFLLKNILIDIENKIMIAKRIDAENNEKQVDINTLVTKMNKLTNLYMNDLIDIDYYKSEYTDLKSKIDQAKCANSPKKMDINNLQRIQEILKSNFMELYSTLDNLSKRRLWASIINYAVVTDKNNINIVVY